MTSPRSIDACFADHPSDESHARHVLTVSHVLWTVVIPTVFPNIIDSSPSPQKNDYSKVVVELGNALFPLTALAIGEIKRLYPDTALKRLCHFGGLECMQYLQHKTLFGCVGGESRFSVLFASACGSGHLGLATWFAEQFEPLQMVKPERATRAVEDQKHGLLVSPIAERAVFTYDPKTNTTLSCVTRWRSR